MTDKHSPSAKGWRRWFATDCALCRNLRIAVVWALIALPLTLWWLSSHGAQGG